MSRTKASTSPLVGVDADHALYEGEVVHTRLEPRRHHLRYRLGMLHLDVARIDEALDRHPLAGRHLLSPVRFRREDHHGDPDTPLDEAVRRTVIDRLGWRPAGPVTMLAHLRTWGWCFNPITLYFCFDATGSRVDAQVCEVTNTPWRDRVAYVFDLRSEPGPRWFRRFRKEMYVSPFMPMDLHYRLRSTGPGARLRLGIDTERDGRVTMTTGLSLRRRPLDRSAITRLLVRYPLLAHRVSVGIHLHAARLALEGVPVHPRSGSRHDGEEVREEAA